MGWPRIDWSDTDWPVLASWLALLLFVVVAGLNRLDGPLTVPLVLADPVLILGVGWVAWRRRDWALMGVGGLCLLPLVALTLALLSCGFGSGACL